MVDPTLVASGIISLIQAVSKLAQANNIKKEFIEKEFHDSWDRVKNTDPENLENPK